MWLFTQYGFYSVVCDRDDENTLVVRARSREHLDLIKSRFREWLAGREIVETSQTDYRFRIKVPREFWKSIAGWLVEEIDYPNFKQRVHDRNGHCEYTHALSDVWEVMFYRLQANNY